MRICSRNDLARPVVTKMSDSHTKYRFVMRCLLRICLWVLGAFTFLFVLWLVFGFYRPFEPHYHGICLSRWANDVGATDEDGTTDSPEIKLKNKNGREAVRHIGVKALPLALKLCQTDDSEFKRKLSRASEDWNNIPFVDLHLRDDFDKHLESVAIYYALGAVAKPAIPSLIDVLQGDKPVIYDAAMQGLRGIGPDSIPSLIDLLTHGNRQGRINAANCLGHYFGRQASNAVPVLLQYLAGNDRVLRHVAAKSLVCISHDPVTVVPAIANYLETETNFPPAQQLAICFRLGLMGTNAQPAIPTLVKLADQKHDFGALQALYKIAPERAKTISAGWNKVQTTNKDNF
jgi:HEAT repeat protein